jgi:hypothetical protein
LAIAYYLEYLHSQTLPVIIRFVFVRVEICFARGEQNQSSQTVLTEIGYRQKNGLTDWTPMNQSIRIR